MILQIGISTANSRVLYPTNLPNGLYEFRLVDITYIDTLANTNHSSISIQSDCWRIPYGNISRGNTIYFYNNNSSRISPQGTYNFLAEIRNQDMDITLTSGGGFTACILTFDVLPSKGDLFFSLV
jgi:hypothetical protein